MRDEILWLIMWLLSEPRCQVCRWTNRKRGTVPKCMMAPCGEG